MKFDANIKAVISGGASGLGYAVAEKVIQAGGRAAMLDVNEEAGRKAAATLGPQALFIKTDVTSEASVNDAVAKARETFGGITLAVSCAGILGAGRVLGREGPMPSEFFSKVIAVNLIGTFNLVKAAALAMQDNAPGADGERGVIVNTASVAAFEGQIGQAAYSASKGGVVGMTLPLAREFARIGVRVMAVAPGIFWTPMMEGMPPEVQESLAKQVPFPPRLGRPQEFADLVAAICENVMLNGECIRLDGAIRMQPK
ncbi:MAG TPA: SDR family NAD(P)-dependent oxidoreductase [Gammaproteobacteria bacterium]|nr:SDR family NAD(P)-dependent oxidoreductase [Gammaproteobacteria bacterium]